MARFVVRRIAAFQKNTRLDATTGYIEHFGVHMPRNNAGDTVLFDSIERLFDSALGPFQWRQSQLRREVTEADVDRINNAARAVLVGGGGLFIADTNRNTESGWQWKISLDNLRRIEVPLALFAVGYNQFRHAEQFSPIFNEHLQETVRKSVFVGLRNSGSIRSVQAHLPAELRDKIVYQPCMTTVLKHFYPAARLDRVQCGNDIAVNLAFDRRQRRFGKNEANILAEIAGALRHAVTKGYRLHAAVHAWDDDPMIEFFRRERIPVLIRRLNLDSAEEIVRFYSSMPLTIGMRGHAQMIPFGCGNAIFSIISHEKMRYFLEDIGHPEWGADVDDPHMRERIIAYLDDYALNRNAIVSSIAESQSELWAITRGNLDRIGEFL